jgi:hypothetical protein
MSDKAKDKELEELRNLNNLLKKENARGQIAKNFQEIRKDNTP